MKAGAAVTSRESLPGQVAVLMRKHGQGREEMFNRSLGIPEKAGE